MYIVFEGIDTSGKTTQINALKEKYPNYIYTKEPCGCDFGEKIKHFIYHESISTKAQTFLFLADRAEHYQEVISQNLNNIIISDRSFISGISYALKDKKELKLLLLMNLYAIDDILPQKIVFFQTNEELLKERLYKKNLDIIEERGIKYLLKVQENINFVIKELKIPTLYVNASLSVEEISKKIQGFIHD